MVDIILSLLAVLGVVSGGLAAAGVVFKSAPIQWLWTQLVYDPIMEAFRREVGEVVDAKLDARPLTNGGWETVKAVAEKLDVEVTEGDHGHPQ